MSHKQNLHVHSVFCDGKDTPEEMVIEAMNRGFDSLGFSIHSYRKGASIKMKPENIGYYKEEIKRLKEKYKDRFKIYLGVEQDFHSESSPEGFEYSLIAVHCLKMNGIVYGFDTSLEKTREYINEHFGGDGMAFAKKYYETLAQTPSLAKFDIIAHIDLVTKNNEVGNFFDQNSKEYLGYAFDAIDALKGKVPFFEVNTGAVARGYRTTHYPQPELLKRLKELGFGATISSDCHDKNYVDFQFDEAREYLLAAGFKSKFVLTDSGFAEVEL